MRPDESPSGGGDRLPARPVLRRDHPVLWRSDDCVQIGHDPRGVVVHGVDQALVRWARGLDGLRDAETAVRDAATLGVEATRARRFLHSLRDAGALDDAGVMPASMRVATPQQRTRLAPDAAAAAHVHPDARATAVALDRRAAARVRVLGRGRVADAVVAALRATGVPVLVVPDPHADDAGAGTAHLDVLADAAHPDVPDDHGATAADRPHLPVVVRGRVARIGPLVVPGVTSCLRCADLHRTDRDPAWPRLAVQLAHLVPATPPVDAALALAAGAVAALRVVAWIEAGSAEQEHATADGEALELLLPGGMPRVVSFPPHPLCGCRWRPAA